MTNTTTTGRRGTFRWVVALLAAVAVGVVALATLGSSSAQAQPPLEVPLTVLSLDKQVDKQRVRVGQTLTYTLRVRNEGDRAARRVEVIDFLPRGVRPISVSNTRGVPCSGRQRVRCSFGTLSPGARVIVRIKVRAVQAGRFNNQAVAQEEFIPPIAVPGGEVAFGSISDTVTHRIVNKPHATKPSATKKPHCGVRAKANNAGAKACAGKAQARARR